METIPNTAPVGTDEHADSLAICVPLLLIDDPLGRRWYPRVLGRDDADALAEALNAANCRCRIIEARVIVPPAGTIDDTDGIAAEPVRLEVSADTAA